jgi:hypothetical protein
MNFLNNWLTRLAEQLPIVHADSASLYAVGTDLTPIDGQLPNISMRREEVDIFVCPGFVVVEALFELENEGVETDLEVGFPCFGRPNPFKAHETALLDFAVTVDGQAVRNVDKRIDNIYFPMWKAWRQYFQAHSRSLLKVCYWTPLNSYMGASRMPFVYILRTGRFWKGVIGKAIVRVHALDIPFNAIQEATPPGYTRLYLG